jgi:UDP-perosamine 4-acetyltransferase
MTSTNTISCLILGGGGHSKVIVESFQSCGATESLGILDIDRSLWGKKVLGVPVLGGDELLAKLILQGTTHFVVGLGGVGDNTPRKILFDLAIKQGLIPINAVHNSANCSPSAKLGGGSVMLPASVVNAQALVGANVIINTGAIVEHDCIIADHVHVATGARLCSTVQVGEGAHIGAGATVRQGIKIGSHAIVGMGAVVVKNVEPNTTVVGIPARLKAAQAK